jgi:hypothetical protein
MYLKIVLLVLAMLPPFAADAAAEDKDTPQQICELKGAWAGLAMQARQMGASLHDQIDLAKPEIGGSMATLLRAYQYPLENTPAKRAKVAEAFGRDVERRCYRQMRLKRRT